jgi:hypothetical protein
MKIPCFFEKGYAPVPALVDSGATRRFITPETARAVSARHYHLQRPVRVRLLDKKTTYVITEGCEATVTISGRTQLEKFLIMPMSQPMVLGFDWLKKNNPDIDWTRPSLRWRNYEKRDDYRHRTKPIKKEAISTTGERRQPYNKWARILAAVIDMADDEERQYKSDLARIPMEFRDYMSLFVRPASGTISRGTGELPPYRPGFDCVIKLKDGFKPFAHKVRRKTPREQQLEDEWVRVELAAGRIRPTVSPVATASHVAWNGNKPRLCFDYRDLNAQTERDVFPIPLTKETLQGLAQFRYFSSLDLPGAFNTIRMARGEEWKAAIITKQGTYEPTVMQFGLCNAPSQFQRYMNYILRKEIAQGIVRVYLDDIAIGGSTYDEHDRNVLAVLETLRREGVKLNARKCKWRQTTLKYLGYVVEHQSIQMDPEKVEAIRDWEFPRTKAGAANFLGFVGFYRDQIQHFAQLAIPLTDATKPGAIYDPTDPNLTESFMLLKAATLTAPATVPWEPGAPLVVETDASDVASGGTIYQRRNNRTEPVVHWSKKHPDAVTRYPTQDQELFAFVELCRKYRYMLANQAVPIDWRTDHAALKYFLTKQQLSGRQAAWAERLSEFDFTITHLKGKDNVVADALSRRYACVAERLVSELLDRGRWSKEALDELRTGKKAEEKKAVGQVTDWVKNWEQEAGQRRGIRV